MKTKRLWNKTTKIRNNLLCIINSDLIFSALDEEKKRMLYSAIDELRTFNDNISPIK